MKRLWIGIVLLAVMLAGGVGMLLFSSGFYDSFSAALESAAEAALSENWMEAAAQMEKAAAQWRRHQRFLAAFTDHEPIEEVQRLLTRLELLEKARLGVDFADTCRNLSHLCEAINESHGLKWWAVL